MTEFRVVARGVERRFVSTLTDEEARRIARQLNTHFARSLAETPPADLTERQRAWLHKLAVDASRPDEKADAAALFALFEAAGKGRRVLHVGGLRYHVAGQRSKYPGSITILDDSDRRYVGRILTNHTLQLVDPDAKDAIAAVLKDPVEAAAAQGRLTGICSFCAATLTDERSITVGYGPTCAANWGLPWGQKGQKNAQEA